MDLLYVIDLVNSCSCTKLKEKLNNIYFTSDFVITEFSFKVSSYLRKINDRDNYVRCIVLSYILQHSMKRLGNNLTENILQNAIMLHGNSGKRNITSYFKTHF